MGLDAVELVMEIEDEFEFQIPDADAEKIQTVGDLVDYVLNRLRPGPPPPCATARAFYNFRRVCEDVCQRSYRSIRPATRISTIFQETQDDAWPRVARELGIAGDYSFDHSVPIYRPAALATVADIVRKVPRRWPDARLRGDPFAEDVFRRVRKIIVEQVGIAESEVHRGLHFINDLYF